MSKKTRYEKYAKKHPRVHTALALFSFFLPILLAVPALLLIPDGREVLGIYSIVGGIVLGIGLALLVGTHFDRELFFRLTALPITVGALIIALSLATAVFAKEYNEDLMLFQLLVFLALFIFLLVYPLQREAIEDRIREVSGLSEAGIEKRKSGLAGYLWYHSLHREYGLRFVYYVNLIFTVSAALCLVLNCILQFSKVIAVTVLPLGLIAAATSITLEIFGIVMSRRTGKSYLGNGRRRFLVGASPYFTEGVILLFSLLLVWLMIDRFAVLW